MGSTSKEPYVGIDLETEPVSRMNLEAKPCSYNRMTLLLIIMTFIYIHTTSVSCVLSASLQASPKLAPPIILRCLCVCVNET